MQVERWRKSGLKSMLEGCSWQWMLEQMYGQDYSSPHASAGTGFHRAIELWEEKDRMLTLGEMKDIAAKETYELCKRIPMDQWFEHEMDPEFVMELAAESVRIWWNEPAKDGEQEVGTLRDVLMSRNHLYSERYISAAYANTDVPLTGTLDWIGEKDGEHIIVDFKTASSFRKWTYKQTPGIEEAVYRYLAHADPDLTIRNLRFEWHVVSAKEGRARLIHGSNDGLALLGILDNAIKDATVLAKYDAFRPRPDWSLCQRKWCQFYEGCQVTKQLSPNVMPSSVTSSPQPE